MVNFRDIAGNAEEEEEVIEFSLLMWFQVAVQCAPVQILQFFYY